MLSFLTQRKQKSQVKTRRGNKHLSLLCNSVSITEIQSATVVIIVSFILAVLCFCWFYYYYYYY